jgi:hypothetical protein
MDLDQERRHLAQADRHIAEAKKLIGQQRIIVQAAIDKRQRSFEAESFLDVLESNLRAFERHRAMILRMIQSPAQSN